MEKTTALQFVQAEDGSYKLIGPVDFELWELVQFAAADNDRRWRRGLDILIQAEEVIRQTGGDVSDFPTDFLK